jgi:hypothetical protein
MSTDVTGVVGLEQVAEPIRSLHRLDHVDYVDLFTLPTTAASDWPAEQWARAVLEEGPAVRRFGFIPWRVLLGLRLGPSGTPGYVHGWTIADDDENWIRLEATSWLMTCNAVAYIEDDQVSVALFVRYDNPVAAGWWRALSPVHRRLMPVILRQGLEVLKSRSTARSRRPVGAISYP